MKKSIRCYFLIIAISLPLLSNSQNNKDIERDSLYINRTRVSNNKSYAPEIIPPSPQSQIFNKYLEHPVTEYHGLPQIEIPLYEVEVDGLIIPITLSYHAGGIKYEQYDGDIGAGWTINAGGYRVSRTIVGHIDEWGDSFDKADEEYIKELEKKYDYKRLTEVLASLNTNPSLAHFGDRTYKKSDSGHDRFKYISPISSGNFAIVGAKNKKNIVNLSQSNVKMLGFYDHMDSLMITEENGTQLYYGGTNPDKNKSYLGWLNNRFKNELLIEQNSKEAKTSWILKKIKTPHNKEISFSYSLYDLKDKNQIDYSINIETAYYYDGIIGDIRKGDPSRAINQISGRPNGSIDFPYFGYTQQMISGIKTDNIDVQFSRDAEGKLTKIIISSIADGTIIKSISFETSNNWHTLLSKLKIGDGKTDEKVYSFDYYPSPNSKGINYSYPDAWGYYRDGGGKNFTPINYADSRVFIEERLDDMFTYRDRSFSIINNSFVREIYLSELATGSPKSHFNFPFYHQEFFKLSEEPTPKLLGFTPKVMGMDDPEESNIFRLNDIYDKKSCERFPITNARKMEVPNYFSLREITYPTGGSVIYEYENNTYKTEQEDNQVGAGLRIKKISSSDGWSNNYEYGVGIPNIKGIYNEYLFYIDAIANVDIESGSGALNESHSIWANEHVKLSEKALLSEYNSMTIQYPKVTLFKTKNNLTTNDGKIISEYSILQDIELSTPSFVGGVRLGHAGRSVLGASNKTFVKKYRFGYNTQLINRRIYDNRNVLKIEENYTYKNKTIQTNSDQITNLHIKEVVHFKLGDTQVQRPGELNSKEPAYILNYVNGTPFHYDFYTLENAPGRLLVEKQINSNEGGNLISNKESYAYDNINRLVSTQVTNSTNGVKQEDLKYPTSDSELYKRNMLSTIMETQIRNNDNLTSVIKTVYTPNSILPSRIETGTSVSDLLTEVTFDRYDSKGNILQYTGLDGVSVSYIWSYNYQYPIAEFRNMTYAQAEALVKTHFGVSSADAFAKLKIPDEAKIRTLRTDQTNVLITTYTYKPMIGVLTITDPRGVTIGYEYNSFGKLKRTYLKEGDSDKTLETYEYNHVNK